MVARTVNCVYCDFRSPSEQLLLVHIRQVHSNDPNFRIECDIEQCRRMFTNYRSYINHIRHHAKQSENMNKENGEDNDDNENNNDEDGSGEEHITNYTEQPNYFNMKDFSAKWILKASESRCLTRTALLGILDYVSEMVQIIVDNIHRDVQQLFETDSSMIGQVDEIFHQPYVKPFLRLETFHLQLQYYKKYFSYVVCIYSCIIILLLNRNQNEYF